MVCHICAVIAATVSDPLRYEAKGRQPKTARKMQRGISIIKATTREVSAGRMVAGYQRYQI